MSLRVAVFRDEGGFTLAEMLVVCALLGTVMAGVLSLLMVGQQSATATANKVDAQSNARMGIDRLIEEVREAGYLPAGPTCPGAPATPCPPYNYAFPAISAQTATAGDIRTVTITLTTQQSAGQPQVTMVHRVRLRNRPTS